MTDHAVEEEDEELKLAIALSLQDHQPEPSTAPLSFTAPLPVPASAEKATITIDSDGDGPPWPEMEPHAMPSGLLGLDRKAMEQERLARKRKLPTSFDEPQKRKAADQKSHSSLDQPIARPQTPTPSNSTSQTAPSSQPEQSKLTFPTGTVRKTWALGYPRNQDIKLEEVLDRHDLTLAVLSSFQWDVQWLLPKINPSTKLIFVMQAKDQQTKDQYRKDTAGMDNLRLCFPSMDGQINCMHSKLMLLAHPTHLRIVVPTANLVSYDWGETGDMENMVFLIDLPRLPPGHSTAEDEMTFFGQELVYFCTAMGLPPQIVQSLHDFDFSATADLAFIHTIGGAHIGADEPWRRTGYCGLGRAIQYLGLGTKSELSIDFVASSIGAVNMNFLLMLYLAAGGDDGLQELEWRNSSGTKGPGHQPDSESNLSARDAMAEIVARNFSIYFPSHDTVIRSNGGAAGGGTNCFQSKWHAAPSFPRQSLRDCQSVRPGLLMHNKILYVQPHEAGGDDRPSTGTGLEPEERSPAVPWAYVGSANCSESAWGKLVRPKKGKGTKTATATATKLNCRNWECGVILPIRTAGARRLPLPPDEKEGGPAAAGVQQQVHGLGLLDVFDGWVPIPMQYPAAAMIEDHRKPWFYAEQCSRARNVTSRL